MLAAYKGITDQIKELMRSMDVVFPIHYDHLFTDVAKDLHIDLSADMSIGSDDVSEKLVQHVGRLSSSTNKAIDAIGAKDASRLQEVLDETKALREEIELLSSAVYEDTLTKAYNRRWIEENYLDSDDKRFDKDGVIAMVDLNDFKHINDTYGHITGDKVLYFIALELRRSKADVVRYGGDEFFVIFDEEVSTVKARLRLHVIREAVINQRLNADGQTFKTSFSYGVASFMKGDDMRSIVQFADEEMYSDKARIKERLSQTVWTSI